MFKIFFCLLNWKRESIFISIKRCCWCLLETKMMLFTWYQNIVVVYLMPKCCGCLLDTKVFVVAYLIQRRCCCLIYFKVFVVVVYLIQRWCYCLLGTNVLFTWYQGVVYLIPRCCCCLLDPFVDNLLNLISRIVGTYLLENNGIQHGTKTLYNIVGHQNINLEKRV